MSIYEGSNQYSTSAEMNVDSVLELDDHYRRVVIPTVSIVAAILISFTGENEDVIKRVSMTTKETKNRMVC